MPILNYTTQIAAEKTVTEIQSMLARAKAQAVMSEYDDDGVLTALSFRIKTGAGVMSFRLPANVQKIFQVLVRQRITPKLRTKEQASRVAWRIVKNALEAMLAWVESEQVDLAQLFLGMAQNQKGETLYESVMAHRSFDLFLLENSISKPAPDGHGLSAPSCWPILLRGDCRKLLPTLADESVQCCVTSPPYWGLRDYGHPGQIGQEATPAEYIEAMVAVFEEVRRVLRKDGTLWLNLGDSYVANGSGQVPQTKSHKGSGYARQNRNGQTGLAPKNLIGIPWRVALALQAAGWWLRSDIIWHKPNPMPESVTDRPTKSHEYLFLLTKADSYYYDHEAIKEPAACGWNGSDFHTGKTGEHQLGRSQVRPSAAKGSFNGKTEAMADSGQNAFRAIVDTRNKRSVWTVSTVPYKEAHFAVYPPELIKPCVLAGTKPGDMVLDPFGGSGTTGQVAMELGRQSTLIELNNDYANIIEKRTAITPGLALLARRKDVSAVERAGVCDELNAMEKGHIA